MKFITVMKFTKKNFIYYRWGITTLVFFITLSLKGI